MFYDVPQLFIETRKHSRDTVRQRSNGGYLHDDDIEQLLSLYECGPSLDTDTSIDFSQIIDDAILNSDSYAAKREKYFSWVFGCRDRQANIRVAQAIKSRLLQ